MAENDDEKKDEQRKKQARAVFVNRMISRRPPCGGCRK